MMKSDFLLFRLYGPMASWGEIAVGQSRHTAAYPSKSALLGFLAAALGIRRDQDELQQALANGYHFAVKIISVGRLLSDYHTTQAPDATGKFRYRTRRDEIILGKARLGTILSSREYRTDALAIVAVSARSTTPYSLLDLKKALQQPKFHLYLGRKSCPLAAPLNPVIMSSESLSRALAEYAPGALYLSNALLQMAINELEPDKTEPTLVEKSARLKHFSKEDKSTLVIGKEPVRYYWEDESVDLTPQQVLIRHDQPISRARWQFSQRFENLFISEDKN